ncbi:major capsid protein, partial [Collinsella sp. LCP19S3_C6]
EQDSTDDSDDSDESEDDDAGESTNEDDSDDTDTDEKEFAVKRRYGGATAGYRGEAKSTTPFTLDPAAPNFKSGEATFLDFAEAFNGISSGRALRATTVGQQTQSHFGHIRRDLPTELVASDEASLVAAIDHATDESRLDGGSLVAAAGWCAPSETIYDFLPTPAAANLFSLPEISLSRGGLRYPVEPDFSTLYATNRGTMTEAQAISGQTKDCIEIPCAEMQEVRMDVLWTCVTSNLLANTGWPELTAKFLENATKGHLHRLSAARLAKVIALSKKVAVGVPALGTAGTVLNSIELHAETLRQKFRLGTSTLEGVAPAWLRSILRADLAYRDDVLPERVTDQILDQHFADRGVRFQWVDDYQPLNGDPASAGYPAEVKVLLYPAGTFFSAVQNVVNLGAIYDSTGLSKNQRTEMFLEDGFAVGQRGYESRELTIPVAINGQVGLRHATNPAVPAE